MNIAIILAGGVGSRVGGDVPKQFVDLAGEMMIMHSMEPFGNLPIVHNIIIVADDKWRDDIENALDDHPAISEKVLWYADPGDNRQLSIFNALATIEEMGLSDMTENVIIHDAARPFVTEEVITACFDALYDHDGAMPVLPMNDTVYYSAGGARVEELLDRNNIFAGQSPEAFDYHKYYEANKKLIPDKILVIHGSSEPAVMAGMNVAMVPGDVRNFKVTSAADMERAEEIFREKY
ncbi:MAG: 2-C-methyl-D-erythritol 4-phosphate cytidylyltransferase [Butyrivibrio sp.]|nr:2-C-methyl-D-erythritol 4-phosphate cytidylyltransferase [Butyrivibrio sp.]